MKSLDKEVLKGIEEDVRDKIKEIKLNKYKSVGAVSLEVCIKNGKVTEEDIDFAKQYLLKIAEGVVTKSGYYYLITREGKNSNTLKLYIARNEYCIACLAYLVNSQSDIPSSIGIMLYNLLLGRTPDKIEKILDDIFREDFNKGEDNDEEV